MYSNPTIVLGTGRCGSSLVAGMLQKLGVNMGEEFIPADRTNPAGFYEDKKIKNLNLSYLAREIEEQKFKDELRIIKHNRGPKNRFWGFKVPSVSQLADIYEQVFNPAYIICERPKKEVIDSMKRCYGWSDEYCRDLYEAREKYIRKREGLRLKHTDIVNKPRETVDKIIKYMGLNPFPEQIEQAVDLVCDKPKGELSVLVATPCLGWIRREAMNALFNISEDNAYRKTFVQPMAVPYESNVNNIIYNQFLTGDYDFLLLVDADNPPLRNPLDLVQLNKDIVGCPTPTRNGQKYYFNVMNKVDTGFIPAEADQGLQEVDAVGSGCMLIKRSVLEKFDFTPEWIDGLRRRTGDFNLCTKVREDGGKVYAHWDYICSHLKEVDLLENMK